MITPTTSIGVIHTMYKFLKVVGKQTVTHKIDLIKIEHCITKRKLQTEKFTYIYAASYEIHME